MKESCLKKCRPVLVKSDRSSAPGQVRLQLRYWSSPGLSFCPGSTLALTELGLNSALFGSGSDRTARCGPMMDLPTGRRVALPWAEREATKGHRTSGNTGGRWRLHGTREVTRQHEIQSTRARQAFQRQTRKLMEVNMIRSQSLIC